MPSKLLLEVANYCWSNKFLEHGEAFEGAPPLLSGEHNMEYYNLFLVYLKLYESSLVVYLNTLDVSIEEFYKDVHEAQNENNDDPYIHTFIDCLLASTDYDSFYRVMAREGSKSAARKSAARLKADSKTPERKMDEGKYDTPSKYRDDDDNDYASEKKSSHK